MLFARCAGLTHQRDRETRGVRRVRLRRARPCERRTAARVNVSSGDESQDGEHDDQRDDKHRGRVDECQRRAAGEASNAVVGGVKSPPTADEQLLHGENYLGWTMIVPFIPS